MLDEEAQREEKDEKSQVETWSHTQMFEVADAKTRRKKEDKKSQVETWSQTHAVEVDDEIPRCRKGAENVRVFAHIQKQLKGFKRSIAVETENLAQCA